METPNRVRLTTFTTFDLERDELKRLYISLSLFQYRYLRKPEYREHLLIENLTKDFKMFYVELLQQSADQPNNLTLYKMKRFFGTHYTKLLEISKEGDPK